GHGIPHRAAAAERPPFTRPGLRGFFEDGRLEAVGRIAGHGVEAPGHLAAAGVIGGDIAAHAELGAAVADQHLALHHARRAGDGVGLRLVDRDHLPDFLAGLRVERDEAAVDGADEDLAV